jgi:two-component system, chemotaxis family, CheB/CheR fusion protein
LLDLAQLTEGRIQLRRERVFIGNIVEGAADDARLQLESRHHHLGLSIEPHLQVDADPARLRQVIHNLIQNAARFTEPGGRIEVTVRRCGEEAMVRVRDSGVGIAPEMLPRVFDLFAWSDRPLDRSYGGLGIGLTLVKRLIEMHGGQVEARSDGPGCGSEFEVRLPALAGSAERPPPQGASQALPGVRVLVVEDNADVAEGLMMVLQALGHFVEVVGDGPRAIAAVGAGDYDAVLMDIGLPGIDGYEVARRIRALPKAKSTFLPR